MYIKDAVALRLRNILNERNISVYRLSYDAAVAKSTIRSVLDPSRRDVSLSTLKKICDGLNMTLVEFFSSNEFYNLDQEIK